MADEHEVKKIVRRRNAITGARFFTRGEERIMAIPITYEEPKKLPPGEKPAVIRARLWSFVEFELTEEQAQAWVDADEMRRDDMVYELFQDEMETREFDRFLTGDVDELMRNDLEEERIADQARYLGVEPKQLVWLEGRLTEDEFSQLSEQELRRLVGEEYPERQ